MAYPMTGLQGVAGAPYPQPRKQRKIPTPYARPSINVGEDPQARRMWQVLPVTEVRAGDTVAGFGLISAAHEEVYSPNWADFGSDDASWTLSLVNAVTGEVRRYGGHETVHVFTAAPVQNR